MGGNYADWKKFEGMHIPSSLELYPDIYEFLKPTDNIIDFGCGFGKTCFELFSMGFYKIVGVDINETGIQYANDHLRPHDSKNGLKFLVEDVTNLSFSENTFTFGIMQALLTAIPEVKDRALVFEETKRVLQPDSMLYIAAFCQTWHLPRYRKRYLDAIEQGYDEGSFPAYNNDTGEIEYVAHHHSEKELVDLLIGAGFQIELFRYEVFTTRSGNKINGMVAVARNLKL